MNYNHFVTTIFENVNGIDLSNAYKKSKSEISETLESKYRSFRSIVNSHLFSRRCPGPLDQPRIQNFQLPTPHRTRQNSRVYGLSMAERQIHSPSTVEFSRIFVFRLHLDIEKILYYVLILVKI